MSDRLSLILNFFEAIEPFKTIERTAYLSDQSRRETDSDHTWHMAILAILLQNELDFEVDLKEVLILILVHDLCEIYAGDTFAHSPHSGDSEEEQRAVERLFALLPPDLENKFKEFWHKFTNGSSPEAKYARALDRLQALAQNVYGSGRVWKEHEVSEEKSRELNHEAMLLDPGLANTFELLYQRANKEELWSD